ncbi:MAG: beta-eliminating lyase-related protein [Planctomycetota bacterium]
MQHHFELASDNTAGAVPEALEALIEANAGFVPAYATDAATERARRAIASFFEHDCEVFFHLTGTAANALAFAHLARSFEAVLCHAHAHVVTDECNAPEFFSGGAKLVTLEAEHGKLAPDAVAKRLAARSDVHSPRIAAVSVTCPTEVGTVYTLGELAAIAAVTHAAGAALHLDGARFANAVVALDVAPAELSWRAGVDVVSFGATKNGLPFGEALVFFDAERARGFAARHKQAAQLASKSRFLTAPFAAFLESGAWRRAAQHANARAAELAAGARALGLEPAHPVEANAVFLTLGDDAKGALAERGWHAYDDVDPAGALRLVCSWQTSPESVQAFLADLAGVLA